MPSTEFSLRWRAWHEILNVFRDGNAVIVEFDVHYT
jgi:hypothetical protein